MALVIDISDVLENAYWIRKVEAPKQGILDIARKIIQLADIVLMDASQDPRSDVGGFIASPHDDCFEKLRNEVVVFEGLHTYGGMSGRAMEVFAIGVEEMRKTEYTEWYQEQVEALYSMIKAEGVPVYKGTRGIALDVKKFLPHIPAEESPKFVLAASLYIQGGMRGKIEGLWDYHAKGEGATDADVRAAPVRLHHQPSEGDRGCGDGRVQEPGRPDRPFAEERSRIRGRGPVRAAEAAPVRVVPARRALREADVRAVQDRHFRTGEDGGQGSTARRPSPKPDTTPSC